MSNTIVLNSSNIILNSGNMSFQYRFQNGSFKIKKGAMMSIKSITMPYAWFNITTMYSNNSFSYTWVDGSVYTVQLQDGFYQTSDLNNALQLSMITNGLYLKDSSGNNVYYLEIIQDINLYGNQLIAFIVPTSLPSGYTAPSGLYAHFYSTPSAITPYFTIPTNNFGSIIGFLAGNYPSTYSATTVGFVSNTTPNLTPVNSIIVRCNLVDNNCTVPSDILDSFSFQNTNFGSNGIYAPNYPAKVALKEGTYHYMTFTFVDQNYNNIYSNDPNSLITLSIHKNF